MRKLSFGRVLDCFCLSSSSGSNSCFCFNTWEKTQEDGISEKRSLIAASQGRNHYHQYVRMGDFVSGAAQTLAFQLKPKMVELRASMHCHGCVRKVEKHISKIDGVTSYQVDLESKKVIVIGDILPFEVLESVSRINKTAQLWTSPSPILAAAAAATTTTTTTTTTC